MDTQMFTWAGIALLVAQSGTFSGLNLAMFGVSALRLRTLAATGNADAEKLLALRRDSNFLLTTILWGNVGTNVLLTLLSDSVLAGIAAFLFSTFAITLFGEIAPQAYFSRHALRMGSLMSPLLRVYQVLLYPLAKPSALLLDAWLGREGVDYVPEAELEEVLRQHVAAPESDIGPVEGQGAINFLALDDVLVGDEGQAVDPASVLRLPFVDGHPLFPEYAASADDPFLASVQASGKSWVLLASPEGAPTHALDADGFLRAALFEPRTAEPRRFCHRPITVRDRHADLGATLSELEAEPGDDVIERDLIVLWGEEKRIITGTDILGRLLRGIAEPVRA